MKLRFLPLMFLLTAGSMAAQQSPFGDLAVCATCHSRLTHADSSLVNGAASARLGEIIILWATGPGVNQRAPRVLVGGVAAEVLYAGEHPRFPGLCRINTRIPAMAAAGNAIPVTLLDPQGASDTVTIALAP